MSSRQRVSTRIDCADALVNRYGVASHELSDLLHLVGFGVAPTALQVDDFDNAFFVEMAMASAHALLEFQIQRQDSQIEEADVCI